MSLEGDGSGSSVGGHGAPTNPAERVSVPVSGTDQATRLLLLTRLIASLNDSTPSDIGEYLRAGLSADLVDKLRTLPLSEALDFAAVDCGISIVVDGDAMRQRLARMERAQTDRAMFEHFIRRGASPQLIGRLFSISQASVRAARKTIAPETATGGRPRQPQEPMRSHIAAAWSSLLHRTLTERERFYMLSTQFPHLAIVALEAVVDDEAASVRSRGA
jgi:hypothetical protein